MKLNAMCNKCGWYGQAEAGSDMIEHPDCNYSATFSQTEVKLYELVEAAKPIIEILDEMSENSKKYASGVMVDTDLIRALRSALLKANGGEG
jgi:hypothetical protein